MTAMDIFKEYGRQARTVEGIRERILRREAIATGTTARPLSPDGGGHGGGDASMRLAEYVGNIEGLREQLREAEARLENLNACCVYLAELLPKDAGDYLLRRFVGHKSMKAIAEETGCSVSTVKRQRDDSERAAYGIMIVSWDGIHLPILATR